MLKAGAYVVVYDPDIQDMYVAQVVKDNHNEQTTSTLVKIIWIVRYPIQHAIICPDCANENPPILGGAVCRLMFLHYAAPIFPPYHESLRDCLADAISEARGKGRNDILEILYRHQKGEYRCKRSLLTA